MPKRAGWAGIGAALVSAMFGCTRPSPTAPEKSAVQYDAIRDVALREGVAVARTNSGRLLSWNPALHVPRALGAPYFAALSSDGSIAVRWRPNREATAGGATRRGADLEIWSLALRRSIVTRHFDYEVVAVLAVSPSIALLLVNWAQETYNSGPSAPPAKVQPDPWHTIAWNFEAGAIEQLAQLRSCEERAVFSQDGARVACATSQGMVLSLDLVTHTYSWPPPLAPDWQPPSNDDNDDDDERRNILAAPRFRPYFFLRSVQLGVEPDSVYLTYVRTAHRQWRLARWTPALGNRLDIIAAGLDRPAIAVLAVAAKAELFVLGNGEGAAEILRAPEFRPETLAANAATCAAISIDGTRIVTGHRDGKLRLWDARTLSLLGASTALTEPPVRL